MYRLRVPELFANGTVNWNSPINKLTYIKNGLTAQLQDNGIFQLMDVVTRMDEVLGEAPAGADVAEVISETVAGWVVSPRSNTCVNDGKYLPRHFNRMGFNVLIDLLGYAYNTLGNAPITQAQLLQRGICQFNENHMDLNPDYLEPGQPLCQKVPLRGNVGTEAPIKAMRDCPCRPQDRCNGACAWVNNSCISRISSPAMGNYVRDVRPFKGDWAPVAPQQRRANTRYTANNPGHWLALGPGVDNDDNGDDDGGGYDDGGGDYDEPAPPPPRRRAAPPPPRRPSARIAAQARRNSLRRRPR